MPKKRRKQLGHREKPRRSTAVDSTLSVGELHIAGFLDRIKALTEKSADSSVLFLLGSGASRQSGIKTGGEMVADWLEILRREDPAHEGIAKERWPTAERLEIPNFDPQDPAASYPAVFARTYRGRAKEGFDYLEAEIAGREPSFGYSVLAQILSETKHRIVITTNFDNLVIDALSIYTTATPLVCGHESLAGFIRYRPTRPQVVKVHRDLFFAPKNTEEETGPLPEEFAETLRELLKTNVPVVIGYGGNDGSLMGVLNELGLGDLPQGIYWCYLANGPKPRAEIIDFLARNNGWLVPINGFDQLMIRLADRLGLGSLDVFLKNRGDERADRYKSSRDSLGNELTLAADESIPAASKELEETRTQSGEALKSLKSVLGRTEVRRSAQEWDSLAKLEPDVAKRQKIYLDGLAALPRSAAMANFAALHFGGNPATHPQAEAQFKRAIELQPGEAALLHNYALYLWNRTRHDEAEALFKRSLEADPNRSNTLSNYGAFLTLVRRDLDAAENLYKRAVEADPSYGPALANYAQFLSRHRGDKEAAEALFKRALEAAPNQPITLANYALLLEGQGRAEEAERLFRRALELAPSNSHALTGLALLLERQGRASEAEAVHRRAIDLLPHDPNTLGNFAAFLLGIGKQAEGLRFLNRALSLMVQSEPTALHAECWMYAYCFRQGNDRRAALAKLKQLVVEHGITTDNWSFDRVIEQASSKHPESAWLKPLARVLSGQEPPSTLESWSRWSSAGS